MSKHMSINFEMLCPVWDLYENNGLNADVAKYSSVRINDNVLVVGSGQGLFSMELEKCGFSVTGVDQSHKMAEMAFDRRGLTTIVSNYLEYKPSTKYNTIVISTGLIDDVAVRDERYMANLINHTLDLVAEPFSIIIAYFRHTPWIDFADSIGLYDVPSGNQYIWENRKNIPKAIKVLKDMSESGLTCSQYDDMLLEHANLIVAVGYKYQKKTGRDPKEFVRRYTGFYPYDLKDDAECFLRERVRECGLEILKDRKFNNNDTGVLFCGYKN